MTWRVPNTREFGGKKKKLSRRSCRGGHGGYVHLGEAGDAQRAVTARLSRKAVRTARRSAAAGEVRGARVIGERPPAAQR